MYKGWLEGTNPVAASDGGYCQDCSWTTSYSSEANGAWKSKTPAKIKVHVRQTGHEVKYRQVRASLIHVPDDSVERLDTTPIAEIGD